MPGGLDSKRYVSDSGLYWRCIIFGEHRCNRQKKTEALLVPSNEIGVQVNAETKRMFVFMHRMWDRMTTQILWKGATIEKNKVALKKKLIVD